MALRNLFVLSLFGLVTTGCYYWQTPVSPMPFRTELLTKNKPGEHLVVFLPGLGDDPEAFWKASFFTAELHRNFDVMVLNAHFGYYRTQSLCTRVREDILPKIQHYRQVTLAGISMGGYGAIRLDKCLSDSFDRIILFAPFLGDSVWQQVLSAGSLRRWHESWQGAHSSLEYGDDAWPLLYQSLQRGQDIWLAFGTKDKFANQAKVLAKELNKENIFQANCSHRWVCWRRLWTKVSDHLTRIKQ